MNTRVKVPRKLLIQKIKEEIERENKRHAKAVEKYERELEALLPKVRAAVEDFLKNFDLSKPEKAQEIIQNRVSNVSWHKSDTGILLTLFGVRLPDPPGRSNTDYLEKVKRVLEASTDEVISVSSRDDYYRFL